jgi:hypothetical protein
MHERHCLAERKRTRKKKRTRNEAKIKIEKRKKKKENAQKTFNQAKEMDLQSSAKRFLSKIRLQTY